MVSPEKERIPFLKPVDVNEGDKKGNVERWLLEIEGMMRDTLMAIVYSRSFTSVPGNKSLVMLLNKGISLIVNLGRLTSSKARRHIISSA